MRARGRTRGRQRRRGAKSFQYNSTRFCTYYFFQVTRICTHHFPLHSCPGPPLSSPLSLPLAFTSPLLSGPHFLSPRLSRPHLSSLSPSPSLASPRNPVHTTALSFTLRSMVSTGLSYSRPRSLTLCRSSLHPEQWSTDHKLNSDQLGLPRPFLISLAIPPE